jgi:hypothetical protein
VVTSDTLRPGAHHAIEPRVFRLLARKRQGCARGGGVRGALFLLLLGALGSAAAGCQDDAGDRPPRVDAFRGCPTEDGGAPDGSDQLDAGAEEAGAAVDAPPIDAPTPDAARDVALSSPDALGGTGPKVLLISIDGLRPDGIMEAPAVNLLNLTCGGAYSWEATTIIPSITLTSHASMVSGFAPEVHGLYWNEWRPGYIPVPTVFQAAHEAGLRTVMVVGKDKLQQLAVPGSVDTYVYAPGGDQDVAANALTEIQRGFDLMFVHLPEVDLNGHANAWMSDSYLNQVIAADAIVGRLLAAIPPRTTVIISADHGGKGFSHFAGISEDVTIPWIISGPHVRRGHRIRTAISTTDTAATIAELLKLPMPAGAVGRPVFDALLPIDPLPVPLSQ